MPSFPRRADGRDAPDYQVADGRDVSRAQRGDREEFIGTGESSEEGGLYGSGEGGGGCCAMTSGMRKQLANSGKSVLDCDCRRGLIGRKFDFMERGRRRRIKLPHPLRIVCNDFAWRNDMLWAVS